MTAETEKPRVPHDQRSWRGGSWPRQRDDAWENLSTNTFDVLVVGGGITGVGVALDAATRGLQVALVEARDLASGTSTRSPVPCATSMPPSTTPVIR